MGHYKLTGYVVRGVHPKTGKLLRYGCYASPDAAAEAAAKATSEGWTDVRWQSIYSWESW